MRRRPSWRQSKNLQGIHLERRGVSRHALEQRNTDVDMMSRVGTRRIDV